jgi:UDP-N-acetylmuramoylalanine--D-glutamate ligase
MVEQGMASPLPRRALVLGLARSGQAAALALAERGVRVIAVDRDAAVDASQLSAAGIDVRVGSEPEDALNHVDLLVKSPGVPGESALVRGARARGLPVWSEVELGYVLLERHPFVGVTGTKGKTTTTELVGAMLDAAEVPAEVTGNIASPSSPRAPLTALRPADGAWIVCELSSFQLEDVKRLRCRIAVLTNLEPDHLDRHGSMLAYREAKLRIFENQTADDVAVVPQGFQRVPGDARRVEFAADDPLPAEPRIPGRHNRANAAAATAAARAVGVDDAAIATALQTFEGVPHRLELVRERNGVRWVNDSIATNTLAVRNGVAAYDAPIRLILGGRAKGEDYAAFARGLPANVVSTYVLGEAAAILANALAGAGRAHVRVRTLAEAVAAAAADARAGDVVLLSPACASYDQYGNFEERGEDFRRLVQNLPE